MITLLDFHGSYKCRVDKDGKYIMATKGAAAATREGALQYAKDYIDKQLSKQSVTSLSGVVSAQDISKLSFNKIELTGSYEKEFGSLYSDTQIMIWGQPGNGKTVWLLNFAQYLSEKLNKKVLYIANEEWNRSTLTEKINQFKIGHDNLKITKNLESLSSAGLTVEDFDVVFFDSINSLGMDLKAYKEFVEKHPGRIYVLIVQSTKDGDFRGGKDWEHEVDVAGEIYQRKLDLRKNRIDKKFLEKQNAKEAEKQKEKLKKGK